jgi:WD40 repeat protein
VRYSGSNSTAIHRSCRRHVLSPEELTQDYDLSDDPGLKLVQSALQLSAHVLREDPIQLPSQLFARLAGLSFPTVQALLAAARRTDLSSWLCPLWASLTGPSQPLLRTLRGHFYQVNAVVMTQDGLKIVSGSSDRTVRLWDLESGAQLRELTGHSEPIFGLALIPPYGGRWSPPRGTAPSECGISKTAQIP